MKLAKTSPEFRSHLAVFNKKQSTHDEISEAGGKLLMMMYGVKHLKSLNRARYFRFKQLVARKDISTNTQLCILPPTIGSAWMHSFRVFLQVQSWHGNDLNPLEYGWENQAGNLLPIGSASPSAPERLIKLIFCDCRAGCKVTSACRCRKANLVCNPMCSHCVGLECTNILTEEDTENLSEVDDN